MKEISSFIQDCSNAQTQQDVNTNTNTNTTKGKMNTTKKAEQKKKQELQSIFQTEFFKFLYAMLVPQCMSSDMIE
eukprot:Pgem_evm1s18448